MIKFRVVHFHPMWTTPSAPDLSQVIGATSPRFGGAFFLGGGGFSLVENASLGFPRTSPKIVRLTGGPMARPNFDLDLQAGTFMFDNGHITIE
jgi:hypothetical protein